MPLPLVLVDILLNPHLYADEPKVPLLVKSDILTTIGKWPIVEPQYSDKLINFLLQSSLNTEFKRSYENGVAFVVTQKDLQEKMTQFLQLQQLYKKLAFKLEIKLKDYERAAKDEAHQRLSEQYKALMEKLNELKNLTNQLKEINKELMQLQNFLKSMERTNYAINRILDVHAKYQAETERYWNQRLVVHEQQLSEGFDRMPIVNNQGQPLGVLAVLAKNDEGVRAMLEDPNQGVNAVKKLLLDNVLHEGINPPAASEVYERYEKSRKLAKSMTQADFDALKSRKDIFGATLQELKVDFDESMDRVSEARSGKVKMAKTSLEEINKHLDVFAQINALRALHRGTKEDIEQLNPADIKKTEKESTIDKQSITTFLRARASEFTEDIKKHNQEREAQFRSDLKELIGELKGQGLITDNFLKRYGNIEEASIENLRNLNQILLNIKADNEEAIILATQKQEKLVGQLQSVQSAVEAVSDLHAVKKLNPSTQAPTQQENKDTSKPEADAEEQSPSFKNK